MISLLRGELIEATASSIVLDVMGMGFELGVSSETASSLPQIGHECGLYTRMQVREDAISLFGFATKEERTMFDRLVAVSGVGPRLALAVLSRFTVSQLYSIVMAEDDKSMTAVPGVGKKTAQRLILELKSVLSKDKAFVVNDAPVDTRGSFVPNMANTAFDDAHMALLSMGFSSQEADLALEGCGGADMRVEQLLGAALKRLGMEA